MPYLNPIKAATEMKIYLRTLKIYEQGKKVLSFGFGKWLR